LNKRGRLVVLSAPSGGGKSTVIKEILKRHPDFIYSVSSTTRPKRNYEVEGFHYYFLTRAEFEQGITENRFIEFEEVHGDLYGTDRRMIEKALNEGKNILLDLDVNGGDWISHQYPGTILIFLYPPSIEELRERLRRRGADDETTIEKRLSRYPMEKAKGDRYPHHIVNENLEDTIERVLEIIDKS